MTQAMPQTPTTHSLINCPGCGKAIAEEFYLLHINGDGQNAPHTLHVFNIAGVGTQVVPANTTGKPQPRMMDLPLIGRVRTDAFIAYTLGCITLGALLGLRII